jgi:hypothetical protein
MPTPALSTHAKRNPAKAVQAPRTRPKQSTATKATKALASAQRAQQQVALGADIELFYQEKKALTASLALKHDKKEPAIRKLLNNATYKNKRAVNLYNAIIHDLCLQAAASKHLLPS